MDAIISELRILKAQTASDYEDMMTGFRQQQEHMEILQGDMKTIRESLSRYRDHLTGQFDKLEELVYSALADIQELKRMAHTHP